MYSPKPSQARRRVSGLSTVADAGRFPPQPESAPRTITPDEAKALLDRVAEQAGRLILGKDHAVRLALACLMARGHLLIEDLPGVGKTLLAHVLAQALGLGFQRIQFTSDLLPADILGVSVYDKGSGEFVFHPGPVFSQVVLVDEINRATPKTQSALLEAMEERQVTLEGQTRSLPAPFFVVATQNPRDQFGTFPLPESQLDRFLMRLRLGLPDASAERALLKGRDRREMLDELAPCMSAAEVAAVQRAVPEVHAADGLLDYLQELLEFTRRSAEYRHGLSPRAGLALLRSAQAWAVMEGREYVIPEDVQTVLPAVAGHRLVGDGTPQGEARDIDTRTLIESVPVP